MISILLVDDHFLFRLGLIEAIKSQDEMNVIDDVSSGKAAIESYEEHRPDVVIMDFRMPEANGAETTALLLKKYPDAKVLILSSYEKEEDIWRAVKAGAQGYLTKGTDAQALWEAITTINKGMTYFPARIVQKIRKRHERSSLTKREIEVLKLLVQGLSNKEIGKSLSIAAPTVKLHLSNLFQKLGVEGRTQAVLIAIQRGIFYLDD